MFYIHQNLWIITKLKKEGIQIEVFDEKKLKKWE